MPFLGKFKTWFPPKRPTRSKPHSPPVDPRLEHPTYKNIPTELLAAVVNPAGLRHPPYDDGYCGSVCVDAMRFLLDKGAWTFNEPGSRLWLTTEGVFLDWGHGAGEIIQQVLKNQANGFPRSEHSLLAAIYQHELIEPRANGSLTWHIAPHVLFKNGKGQALRCVKLQNPDELFPGWLKGLRPISASIGQSEDAYEYLAPADSTVQSEDQSNAGKMLASPSESQVNGPGQCTAVEVHVTPDAPRVVQPAINGRLSDVDTDFLRSNPSLACRLLYECKRNKQIRELQNRAFLPLTGLITEADLPALKEAGWLWPNLASRNDELTRIRRGVTGVILNTKLSLIFCRITNAKWHPRCHATLPEELRTQVIRQAVDLLPFVSEEQSRGAPAYSLSFWARDRFQSAYGLSQDEVEQVILHGLEAVRVSNERKYYFAADVEFQF